MSSCHQELACLQTYDRSQAWITTGNFALWGTLAYLSLDFTGKRGVPKWMSLWGAAAISAGAFGTMYMTTKYAARTCLQCIIDVRDKNSEFYKTARKLLKDHHPQADGYLSREKFKLMRPAADITSNNESTSQPALQEP
jgi:hypothetical protein